MESKIRAKQLHPDVSSLVYDYGKEYFWPKSELLNYSGFFDGIKGSGFMIRDKVPVQSGASGVYIDVSLFNFEVPPFFNYSLIAPTTGSDFFVNHASNVTNSGIQVNFSSPINESGYYLDVIFGSEHYVIYAEDYEAQMALLINNLAATGTTLWNRDTQMSGTLTGLVGTASGTLATNLAATGTTLWNRDTQMSGTLTGLVGTASGTLATNLAATGTTLWNRDTQMSGTLVSYANNLFVGTTSISISSNSITLHTGFRDFSITNSGTITGFLSGITGKLNVLTNKSNGQILFSGVTGAANGMRVRGGLSLFSLFSGESCFLRMDAGSNGCIF